MEWNEVKAKPKRKVNKKQDEDSLATGSYQPTFAAQQMQHHAALNNQASAIANYDYGVNDEDEEIKYETVSHECAQAVQAARIAKKLTQE